MEAGSEKTLLDLQHIRGRQAWECGRQGGRQEDARTCSGCVAHHPVGNAAKEDGLPHAVDGTHSRHGCCLTPGGQQVVVTVLEEHTAAGQSTAARNIRSGQVSLHGTLRIDPTCFTMFGHDAPSLNKR